MCRREARRRWACLCACLRLAVVVRTHLCRAVRALDGAPRTYCEDAAAAVRVGGARGAHVRLVGIAARVDGVPRVPGPLCGGDQAPAQAQGGGEEEPRAAAGLAARLLPFLSTPMNKGQVNPRNHTILQALWDGMLEGH